MKTSFGGWMIVPLALAALSLCAERAAAQRSIRGGASGFSGTNSGMPKTGTVTGRPNNFNGGTVTGRPNNVNGGNTFAGNVGGGPPPPANNNDFFGKQPGNANGQPGGLGGNPPNNFNGQPGGLGGNQPNNFNGQPAGFAGNPPNNFNGQPAGFAGRQPDVDWGIEERKIRDEANDVGRKATGGMIAMGVVSMLCGMAILGCVGWLVWSNNDHSSPGGKTKRRRRD